MTDQKEHLVVVTDAQEIESIKRNDLFDIIGACVEGVWWAYSWSVKRWRADLRSEQHIRGEA